MKYIRTKDGIYRVLQYGSAKKHYVVISVGLGHKVIDTSEIIKQANTIEELCDEFVYKYVNPYHQNDKPSYELVNMTLENMKLTMEMTSGATFYGAVWTDKGLIYVAKMNEKGELCLI